MNFKPIWILIVAAMPASFSLFARPSRASDAEIGPRFVRRYCVECHGSDQQEADLRLDQVESMQEGDARELWHEVLRQVRSGQMPPDDARQPGEEERSTVASWITDEFGELADPRYGEHWAFIPPKRVEFGSIDEFVARKLEQVGLSFSQPADRRTLIRRATLDLTGLLPTVEEVRHFVEDPDSTEVAFARVIDRLLDSPRYGERWAQHWLDVIRWAETVGFETNAERRDAWHYRDWVIRSFNVDLRYDEFIREQLIGDALGSDSALGFLVAGPANLPGQIGRDEEAMRQARQDELDEVIRTVSQSFFGLTIGCARCHDHKFDPVSQHDYYSMQAIFEGLRYGTRRLRGPVNDQWNSQVPEARKRLDQLRSRLSSLQAKHGLQDPVQSVQTEAFSPVAADAVRMEIAATTSGPASLYEFEVWSASGKSPSSNVALASSGAIPSASSFALANQTRHFDNLVDGSIDRRQAFPWVAASGGPAWIQIEFAKEAVVDRVTWHQGSSIPADYRIQVRESETGQWLTVADTGDRLPRVDDLRSADRVEIESLSPSDVRELFELITEIRKQDSQVRRLTAGPQTYAAAFSDSPDVTMLLHRGDPMSPREAVEPAVPAFLEEASSSTDGSKSATIQRELDRREMLVSHLTDAGHPLTTRVLVNRVWQHHFGTGIVETSSDFGRMGTKPSHPELLDWIALQFVDHGWSIKQLHRLIMNTQTYRQASLPRQEAIEVDADSRLLWRFPPRRLDAEAIRDSILSASGKLNLTMYGRGFDLFNQRGGLSDYRPKETFSEDGWRRMIYAHKVRMQSVDVFGAFDCPDAGQMTPRRNRSTTPVQSLGLFNSPFIARQAEYFAERVERQSDGDLSDSIRLAFEMATSRNPDEAEHHVLLGLAEKYGLAQVCRVIFNSSEFVFLN